MRFVSLNLIIGALLSFNCAFAYSNYDYGYNENIYRNYNTNPSSEYMRTHYPYQNQIHFKDLDKLEKYSLNQTFPRDSELQRLQRLEMQAFGAVQSGDLDSRYENVKTALLSRPTYNYKTSLLRNLGNYFAGQMTGFTPSLSNDPFLSGSSFPSTPYPTTYGNRTVTQFSGPFQSGYRYGDSTTGNYSRVKILD